MKRALSFFVFSVALAVQASGQAHETYTLVALDSSASTVHIETADHRTLSLGKQPPLSLLNQSDAAQHTSWEGPVVSENHQAVGVQAVFSTCCPSSSLPLQLVVYADGVVHRFHVHRFQGTLPIFAWHFVDGGTRVAFSQRAPHGDCFVHWELRDVTTERLLDVAEVPVGCEEIPNPPLLTIPSWVMGPQSEPVVN